MQIDLSKLPTPPTPSCLWTQDRLGILHLHRKHAPLGDGDDRLGHLQPMPDGRYTPRIAARWGSRALGPALTLDEAATVLAAAVLAEAQRDADEYLTRDRVDPAVTGATLPHGAASPPATPTRATRRVGDRTITFPTDDATARRVFEALVEAAFEWGVFSGESVMQTDPPQIESPQLVARIFDECGPDHEPLFSVKYDDDPLE